MIISTIFIRVEMLIESSTLNNNCNPLLYQLEIHESYSFFELLRWEGLKSYHLILQNIL